MKYKVTTNLEMSSVLTALGVEGWWRASDDECTDSAYACGAFVAGRY